MEGINQTSGILDAWTFMRRRELSDPDLSDEQRYFLESSTANDVIREVRRLEAEHADSSRGRQYLQQLQPLTRFLERFSCALDAYVQADSHGILALVWGSLRVVLVVAKDLQNYFDEFLGFLCTIGQLIERLQIYERLVPTNLRFNSALCRVFDEFFAFIRVTRTVLRAETIHKRGIKGFGAKMLKANVWSGFKKDVIAKINTIKVLCQEADEEARLAATVIEVDTIGDISAKMGSLDVGLKSANTKAIDEELRAFGLWMHPVEVDDDLVTLNNGRMQGSCNWILQDQNLADFIDGGISPNRAPICWISGPPGSGKSYLSSFLVEHLQQTRNVGYFFCKTDDQNRRSAISIIRTWSWQIFSALDQPPKDVLSDFSKGATASKTKLTECFLKLIKACPDAFMILDGLDECSTKNQAEILTFFQVVGQATKMVVFSRDEHQIRSGIRKACGRNQPCHILISPSDTSQSIERFIIKRIDDLELEPERPDQQDYIEDAKISITRKLLNGAEGNFLWARLMLDHLETCPTIDAILNAVDQAPDGLESMYGRTLDDIYQLSLPQRQIAFKMLRWILYAFRPLTVAELGIAVAIDPGQKLPKSGQHLRNLEVDVHRFCRSLVEIDQQTREIRIVHASVKDFLLQGYLSPGERTAPFKSCASNASIARTCLTFLASMRPYIQINADRELNTRRFKSHIDRFIFVEYSSVFWINHAVLGSVNGDEQQDEPAIDFCRSSANVVRWLQIFRALDARQDTGITVNKRLLDDIILPRSIESIRLQDLGRILTPHSLEVLRYHLGPISRDSISRWRRFLIDDHDAMLPPIIVAVQFDFLDVVQQELASGCVVDVKGPEGGTPIYFAARADAVDCVNYLIERGANVNDRTSPRVQTPLQGSIANNFISFSTRTFWLSANPFYWHTSFFSDSLREKAEYGAAHILLEAGADPLIADDWGNNALHSLVQNHFDGQAEIRLVHKLLDRDKNCNRPNLWRQTPLFIAVQLSCVGMVRALLEYERDNSGMEAVKLLVEFSKSGSIDTALLKACCVEDSRVGHVLVDFGASVTVQSTLNGFSTLQLALEGARNLIPCLLEHGADPNLQDNWGSSALHDAARLGLREEIIAFTRHGCNLDKTNALGETALIIAFENQHLDVVKTLIDLDADRSRLSGFGDVSTDTNIKAAMVQHTKRQDSWPQYFPKSYRDVFESFSILERAFKCRLPGKRVREILDTAEYWLRTSVSRNDRKVFDQHNCDEEYLQSPPVTGREDRPVRRVVFTLISRDQGWSDAVQHHGTYDASWSYWDACRILAGSRERHPRISRIQYNLHAYPCFRTLVQVWGVSAGSPDDDRWTAAGTAWIDELKIGDCVAVWPRAEFPGWVNEVAGAKIEVYTSVLLR